jgi:hypothetical protein
LIASSNLDGIGGCNADTPMNLLSLSNFASKSSVGFKYRKDLTACKPSLPT